MKQSKTALVAAVDLLARRAHSVKEIGDKLRRKGYGAEEVAAAVATLSERGYLNDQELCARVYRQYVAEERHSLRQIACKLLQKGFTQVMIKECSGREDQALERRAALRALRLKYKSPAGTEPLRMMQYLYGKGYMRASIQAAVEAFSGAGDLAIFDES